MPTHNRADIVGLAIRSVLDQTERDFELLVVADGCTDATCDVVRGIGDARIRLFDLPKVPYFGYANRNVALREARGDVVAMTTHDDLLFPDHLARLLEALEPAAMVWAYSRPLWVSRDGVIVPFGTDLTRRDELAWFLETRNTIPATCVAYRRACLDRYGYFPEDVPVAADWVYWNRIITAAGPDAIAYVSAPTSLHFCANWKRTRFSGSEEVRAWLEIADTADWWPFELAVDIPVGAVEQTIVADRMQSGGDAWIRSVRHAISHVLERVPWDQVWRRGPRPVTGEST